MEEGIHFVGAGDTGNRTAIELSRIYESLGDDLFYKEHDQPQNHLHIHSYTGTETVCCDENYVFIILAGSVHDPCWGDARKTLNESGRCSMFTIGIDNQVEMDADAFQSFPDEYLIFPDQSFFNPIELAKLALQIFFIHTPWSVSGMGSLVGLDLADTTRIFAGKVTKVKKIALDKEHYRQNFSKFLSENKADLIQAKGILMSLWVFSLQEANELSGEINQWLMSDVDFVLTVHALTEDESKREVTLFIAL